MKAAIAYHKDCLDGAAAAWACLQKYPDAKLFPVAPDTAIKTNADHIYYLDMCPPAETLEDPRVICIDHHKTSRERLGRSLLRHHWDDQRSGAGLTWDVLFPDKPRPPIIDYIEDRDLWAWKLPFSREVAAACSTTSPSPVLVDLMVRDWDLERYTDEGSAILAYQRHLITQITEKANPIWILGDAFMSVNSPVLQSDVGNDIVTRFDCPVLVWHLVDNEIRMSFRSRDDLLDVSVVASYFGGGGHRNAAGASVSLDTFDIWDLTTTKFVCTKKE